MAPKRLSDRIVTFAFVAVGIWLIVYALGGYKWYEMDSKELALVQGCYAVEGKPLFRIDGKTLISGNVSWGFEGSHEKGGDVLTMNHPLQFSRLQNRRLVDASNSSMVDIHYGPPLNLVLWDDQDQPVQAVQIACSR